MKSVSIAMVVTAGLVGCYQVGKNSSEKSSVSSKNPSIDGIGTVRDCSEAYGNDPVQAGRESCIQIACDEKYQGFLGSWEGPFLSSVRVGRTDEDAAKVIAFYAELKHALPSMLNVPYFRPYQNKITYDAVDCLKNIKNGDEFIIGRATNTYPEFQQLKEKVETSRMVTGKHADGSKFLRTLDERVADYTLVSQDPIKELSVWQLDVPEAEGQPAMTFTIVDGRDVEYRAAHKRHVSIAMKMPFGDGTSLEAIVAFGHHTLQKSK